MSRLLLPYHWYEASAPTLTGLATRGRFWNPSGGDPATVIDSAAFV
jgi:hypothetical protein